MRKIEYVPMCLECMSLDSRSGYGDITYCTECRTVEGSFKWLTESEENPNQLVDSDGNICDEYGFILEVENEKIYK